MAHARISCPILCQGIYLLSSSSYTYGPIFFSWYLQKFNNIEWVDMLTCNLVENVHNI